MKSTVEFDLTNQSDKTMFQAVAGQIGEQAGGQEAEDGRAAAAVVALTAWLKSQIGQQGQQPKKKKAFMETLQELGQLMR